MQAVLDLRYGEVVSEPFDSGFLTTTTTSHVSAGDPAASTVPPQIEREFSNL